MNPSTEQSRAAQDLRLTRGELKVQHLPLELEAYPYYPQGILIPVSSHGCIIITDTAEFQLPAVEVGVYDREMADAGSSLDVPLTELEGTITMLLCEIRHDPRWLETATRRLERLREVMKWT